MTTKQIADAVGKEERTVQRWVKALGDKMSSINDKMSSSSPVNPADYDLEETLAIIEQGMGKNAADVYRLNAASKNAIEKIEKNFNQFSVAVLEAVKKIDLVQSGHPSGLVLSARCAT
jgi:transposase